MSDERRRRNRILLVGTFLFFFLPIVGAWLLNVFAPDWRPFGTTNYGALVQPVRPITAVGLRRADGAALDAGYLNGRWTLVHIHEGACDGDCQDGLARLRQVQQALGDDMNRVQLLAVGDDSGNDPGDATAVVAEPEWLAAFSFADPPTGPGIYLVDPQGYLMMRYPSDAEQRGVLTDLERLLKISKIG